MILNEDLQKLTPEAKVQLAQELKRTAAIEKCVEPQPDWFNGKSVNQVEYCRQLLANWELRSINHCLYSMDGKVDEGVLEKRIADDISPYVHSSLDRQVESIIRTIKIMASHEPIPLHDDRIHFRNGTYYLNKGFEPTLEWTMNRIPVDYDPDAPMPEVFWKTCADMFHDDDLTTVLEFLGYCLIPSNKGQAMLMILGNGGEGKSRITVVMRKILGNNLYVGSMHKLSHDKFSLANLRGMLMFIDDDMDTEALPATNTFKEIVTCEGEVDMEVKNQQSFQSPLYSRLLLLGNGSLKSLHDKSNGFYRRQIIIITKPRPADRVDDPFLKEKLEAEAPGIVNLLIIYLENLIKRNYQFTLSAYAKQNKQDAITEGNNIPSYLKSSCVTLLPTVQDTTRNLYNRYCRWCYENVEKSVSETTFGKYLSQHAAELGINPNKNVIVNGMRPARGFDGICLSKEHQYTGTKPDEYEEMKTRFG